ncbi:MAG: hypothetical protein ABL998_21775, partial [Planctomycetota bacterium]
MKIVRAWLAGVVVLAALAIAAAAQEIHGRLLLPDGKPAVGARLGRGWQFADPAMKDGEVKGWGDGGLEDALTDEAGAFRAPPQAGSVVFARDASGKFGALVSMEAAASEKGAEVTLVPLVEVRGRYRVLASGPSPTETAFWVSTTTMGAGELDFVAFCRTKSNSFHVWLPPGEYRTWTSNDSVNLNTMEQLDVDPLVVEAGREVLDLGSFELRIPAVVNPEGVVRDASGPVSGASIGSYWISAGGSLIPFSGAATSEAEGRFRASLKLHGNPQPLVLLAFDATRAQGALGVWDPRAPAPLELTLVPTTRVHGRFAYAETKATPSWTNVYITYALSENVDGVPRTRDERILSWSSKDATFDFRLPPGTYWFDGYGTDSLNVKQELRLAPNQAELDLGVVELPQTIVARHI